MTSKFRGLCLMMSAAAVASQALGPGRSAQAQVLLEVPNSECPCSVLPFIIDPQCQANWFCTRVEKNVEEIGGQVVQVGGSSVTCDTCRFCCAPNAPDSHCITGLQVCDTRSFSFSIDPGIEIDLDPLKARLGAPFGWLWETSRCWSVEAGCGACPPCTRASWEATLEVKRGVTARVLFQYAWRVEVTCGSSVSESFQPPCSQTRQATMTSTKWNTARAYARAEPAPPCEGAKDDGSQ